MPGFASNSELPAEVKNQLPPDAQDVYRWAFNNALAMGVGSGEANSAAWSKVAHGWVRDAGEWVSKAGFDPNQPRDDHGRWTAELRTDFNPEHGIAPAEEEFGRHTFATTEEGKTLAWHGTAEAVLEDIMEEGITFEGVTRVWDARLLRDERGRSVYVTNQFSDAQSWAQSAVGVHGQTADNRIILRLEIPKDVWRKFKRDEKWSHGQRAEFPIPPDMITSAWKVDSSGNVHEMIRKLSAPLGNGRTRLRSETGLVRYAVIIVDGEETRNRAARKAGFDPNQPRDEEGQWTDTGASEVTEGDTVKPSASEAKTIRQAAQEAARRRGVKLEIGVREGSRGRGINELLLGPDTDQFDFMPWGEFRRNGVPLTSDGRAKVDFYVYELGSYGELVTNVQAYWQDGSLAGVAEGNKPLFGDPDLLAKAGFDPNQPRDEEGKWTDGSQSRDRTGERQADMDVSSKSVSERIDDAINEVYATLHPNPLNPDQVGFANKEQTAAVFMELAHLRTDNSIKLKWIQAWPRRQGMGTRAIRYLQSVAEKHNVPITGSVWRTGEISPKDLIRYYEGLGFEDEGGGNMLWEPSVEKAGFNPNQPRDEEGKWTDTGATEDTDSDEEEETSAEELRGSFDKDTGTLRQPDKTLDQIYEDGKKFEPEYIARLEEFAKSTGGELVLPPEEFSEPGTRMKSRSSALRKIRTDLDGDHLRVLDYHRATIQYDTIEEARRGMVQMLRSRAEDIVRVKDRIVSPAPGNYRDILVNLREPDGTISELQFSTDAILKAKFGRGHQLYEIARDPNTSFTRVQEINQMMMDLYDNAYELDGDGQWQ